MENFHGFNIDHLLWMLDAALTRQNEKQKAAILKITENKVHYFVLSSSVRNPAFSIFVG